MRHAPVTFSLLITLMALPSQADFCIAPGQYCRGPDDSSSHSKSAPAYPTTNSSLTINPSSVPTDDQWGIGTIIYKNTPDFLLVKGTGRVGAAISLTSGEDTYFGSPSLENNFDYLERQINRDKYQSAKLAAGIAGTLYDNGRDDLTHFRLSLGAIGRYNLLTRSVLPGGGVAAILGPFSLGFASSLDETQVMNYSSTNTVVLHDQQTTYSLGIFLTNLALDYSILNLHIRDQDPMIVQLYTASLLLHRWIITGSYRIENSDRPVYKRDTDSLVWHKVKPSVFGGVQFAPFKYLQIGVFYNYYLLNEISLGATVFF